MPITINIVSKGVQRVCADVGLHAIVRTTRTLFLSELNEEELQVQMVMDSEVKKICIKNMMIYGLFPQPTNGSK